jgi:hypothetical protein
LKDSEVKPENYVETLPSLNNLNASDPNNAELIKCDYCGGTSFEVTEDVTKNMYATVHFLRCTNCKKWVDYIAYEE